MRWYGIRKLAPLVALAAVVCAHAAGPAAEAAPEAKAGAGGGAAHDPGAALFAQKCTGCHTVGRGVLTGPDLVVARTRTPAVLSASIKKMEPRVGPLTGDSIPMLSDLLRDPRAAARIQAAEERALQSSQKLDPPSAAVGTRLFQGGAALQNGGMACVSCHQVGGRGGTVGRDLTDVQRRLGTPALVTAVEQPSYPIMRSIYRLHPVTRQEALHLAKYLEGRAATRQAPAAPPPVLPIGAAIAVGLLGVLRVYYRSRSTGARTLLRR